MRRFGYLTFAVPLRRVLVFSLVAALAAFFTMPVFAYHLEPDANGNLTINGKHFNLNIIGVKEGKKPTMTGSQRHTIFVPLGSKDNSVLTRIYLSPGPDFRVCDGNGFDAPYDCNGVQVVKSVNFGATFQLPCNTHLQDDVSSSGGTFVPCDEPTANTAAYEVFVRELGKPMAQGAQTSMKTCAVDYGANNAIGGGDDVKICSSENVVLVRTTGKPSWDNVTQELTSLKADINLDGHIDRFALFTGAFEEWFWEYDNQGLKLAQIRFYLLD